jgi:hypothetical protein
MGGGGHEHHSSSRNRDIGHFGRCSDGTLVPVLATAAPHASKAAGTAPILVGASAPGREKLDETPSNTLSQRFGRAGQQRGTVVETVGKVGGEEQTRFFHATPISGTGSAAFLFANHLALSETF